MPDYVVTYHITGEQSVLVKNCRNAREAVDKAKMVREYNFDEIDWNSIDTDFNIISDTRRAFRARRKRENE